MKTLLAIWIVVMLLAIGTYSYITHAEDGVIVPQQTLQKSVNVQVTQSGDAFQPATNMQETVNPQVTFNGMFLQGHNAQDLELK